MNYGISQPTALEITHEGHHHNPLPNYFHTDAVTQSDVNNNTAKEFRYIK